MPKFKDLTGEVFGKWTVIGPWRKAKTNHQWFCQCECGFTKWRYGNALKKGLGLGNGCRKCSYQRSDLFQDLTGKQFGKWTVLEYARHPKKHYSAWKCECECGAIGYIRTALLRNPKKHNSCLKCRRKAYQGKEWDLTGHVYGTITVVRRLPSSRKYECRCECGKITERSAGDLSTIRETGCKVCKSVAQKRVAYTLVWNLLLVSARYRGFTVEITRQHLFDLLEKVQKNRCALSGDPIAIAISRKSHRRGGSTASIDRIDSSLGYIEGNVQWVHKRLNRMKGNLPDKEFREWCDKVSRWANENGCKSHDFPG